MSDMEIGGIFYKSNWLLPVVAIAFVLIVGVYWNLIIAAYLGQEKIEMSRRVRALLCVPWGISLFSVGIVVYFLSQMLTACIMGGDVLLLREREAERVIALAFGYLVGGELSAKERERIAHRMWDWISEDELNVD